MKTSKTEKVYCSLTTCIERNDSFFEAKDGTNGGCEAPFISASHDKDAVLNAALMRAQCTSGANGAPVCPVVLEVTLNDQDYTASAVNFSYYSPVAVSSLSPQSGPVGGDTLVRLSGAFSEFGSSYNCSFALDEPPVPATREGPESLVCHAPTMQAGTRNVSVSLNAHDYAASPKLFSAYAPPVVLALSPASGPLGGATRVVVSGVGFRGAFDDGPRVTCRFNTTAVDATVLDDDTLVCVAPAAPDDLANATVAAARASGGGALALAVAVSLNGQQYSRTSLPFRQHAPPLVAELSPSLGPVWGGTLVNLSGSALAEGPDIRCTFKHAKTTVAPRRRRWRAVSRPMPAELPVTTTTQPSRRIGGEGSQMRTRPRYADAHSAAEARHAIDDGTRPGRSCKRRTAMMCP